ncbi:MAG: DUF3795 domain-containing protein [Dehalococcoidia bacterium]
MSRQPAEAKLVAVCGLYCGACPVLRASGDKALAERIAQARDIPVERVSCRGCRAEKGRIKLMGEPVCPTYTCCVEQKGLQFCYECADFPCLKLAPCADKAQLLPHNTKVYNLVLLQKLGLEKWLQMAPQLWSQYFRGKKERGGDNLKV